MKAHLVKKQIRDRNGKTTSVWVRMNSDHDIPRHKMPQIRSEHFEAFRKYLSDNKVEMQDVDVNANDLKPTQKHLDHKKVELTQHMTPEYAAKKKILTSKDGYILDGHHRWAGAMAKNALVPTRKIMLNMKELLPLVNKFPKVEYAKLNDMTANAKEVQARADAKAKEERPKIDYAKRLEALRQRRGE